MNNYYKVWKNTKFEINKGNDSYHQIIVHYHRNCVVYHEFQYTYHEFNHNPHKIDVVYH